MKINLSESITSELPRISPNQIKPGEIWEVSRQVWSPLILDWEEEDSLYPEAVRQFLAGNSSPRYVMVVREPEPSQLAEDVWQLVDVMLLSVQTEYLSEVDLMIPPPASAMPPLLAETWQVVSMLTCNLSCYAGWRLSRQVYDLLLDVGDFYYDLIEKCPGTEEIQSLGIKVGTASAQAEKIAAFHKQESEWATVLELPVAAYRTYSKTMKMTEILFEEALSLEDNISGANFLVEYAPGQSLSDNSSSTIVNLSQWWQRIYSSEWQAVEEIVAPNS